MTINIMLSRRILRLQCTLKPFGGYFVSFYVNLYTVRKRVDVFGILVYKSLGFVCEREGAMARVCPLTGKKVLYGNRVSHAHNKTRHRFMPNLQNVSFLSDVLGMRIRMRLSAHGVRSVEKSGGIDNYLRNTCDCALSPHFRKIKKLLETKTSSRATLAE